MPKSSRFTVSDPGSETMKQRAKPQGLQLAKGGEWSHAVRAALADFEYLRAPLALNGTLADLRHKKLVEHPELQSFAQLQIISEQSIRLWLNGDGIELVLHKGDKLTVLRTRKLPVDDLVAPADRVLFEGTLRIQRANGQHEEVVTPVRYMQRGFINAFDAESAPTIATLNQRLATALREASRVELSDTASDDLCHLLMREKVLQVRHRAARWLLHSYSTNAVPLADPRVTLALENLEQNAIGLALVVARIETVLGPQQVARREKQSRSKGAKAAAQSRNAEGDRAWWYSAATEKYQELARRGEPKKNWDGLVAEHLKEMAKGKKAPSEKYLGKWRRLNLTLC